MRYAIKDTVTSQLYDNLKVKDVASILKIKEYSVYRALSENRMIKNRYLIFKYENEQKEDVKYIPQDILDEWDRVCLMFREVC